jgi:hypothetical protein
LVTVQVKSLKDTYQSSPNGKSRSGETLYLNPSSRPLFVSVFNVAGERSLGSIPRSLSKIPLVFAGLHNRVQGKPKVFIPLMSQTIIEAYASFL